MAPEDVQLARLVKAAVAAAVWVATKATTAVWFAPNALPPLKPNQPNHKSPVPKSVNGRLCGAI